MWSRLTEGLADIVAPEEGIEEEEESDTDQLWNRFTAVVAPPPPPSPLPSYSDRTRATGKNKDTQELYICDLERALVQCKKQNETLENQVREFENQNRQVQKYRKEQAVESTQQTAHLERLRDNTINLHANDGDRVGVKSTQFEQEKFQRSQAQVKALKTQCQAYKDELILLRDTTKKLQTANETLQDEKRKMCSRLAEYEQEYEELLAELKMIKAVNEEEKTKLMVKNDAHRSSIDSQRLYDLEAQLKASEADKVIAQQDVERLEHDLDVLGDVLHQFQVDSKAQKEHVATVEAELERVKKELETRQPRLEPHEGPMNDLERVMGQLAKKTQECDQLREALESTATQYNSERDVIDKRLAAQLVVAYVDSNKKGEVLELMARIMGFTEDQKRRVGVGYPIEGNGGGGLFSSIIGLVSPGEGENTPVDPSTIEGKNFADILSEFLLEEASKGH
ncbi:unnamed protein product [Peronospora belbahrii]|uniref:GRIP domain-containing protein n=1 Tax=Peronospora belbahrii TaxID=622444 RepID=A0ABN8D898_9STRA|nr:unnamed protein product [Peronospora belbahrii]